MKIPLCQIFVLGIMLAAPLAAQEDARSRPPEQLDQLLGPIALYPDALIALILPAATVPSDVVLAARYLQNHGDPARTDDQPWDDSVKALSHYPDLIKWMDENLAWTQQAGDAFREQPDEVMNTVQRLRAEARAAGTLTDNPQQQVIMLDGNISIVPAQPEVIYVPDYDPDLVYVSHPGYYADPFLTFGVGYPTGFWLGYNFDWRQRRIWTIDPRERARYWHDQRDWRHPVFPGRPGNVGNSPPRFWQPRPAPPRSRPPVNNRPRPDIVRPAPFPNTSSRPPASRRNTPERSSDNRNQPPSTTGRDFAPNQRPANSPVAPPPRAPAPQPPARPPAEQPAARPAPAPAQPSPSVRQGNPGRDESSGRNEREKRDRDDGPDKAAQPPPPPAPPPAPAQRQARPTAPTPQPSRPPAQDDNDNRDNRDDRRERQRDDRQRD